MVVPISHGKTMQIDPGDLPILDGCKVSVYANGYAVAPHRGGPPGVLVSRLIMGLGKGDKRQVDHINHDLLDNRRENLRIVTQSQNQWNLRKKCTNTSGHKGVYWNCSKSKWQVGIYVNRRNIFIGRFDSLQDAVVAREAAAKLHHGEYAHS